MVLRLRIEEGTAMIVSDLFEPTQMQLRMAELAKKDRCCGCHHPLSECPYYGDNEDNLTTEEKNRICDRNSGGMNIYE